MAAIATLTVVLAAAATLAPDGQATPGEPEDPKLEDLAECEGYTPHPPIVIEHDHGPTGFALDVPATGAEVHRPGSGVVAGEGTEEDPYRISGWCITGAAGARVLEMPALVTMLGTDAHVVIEDNVLVGLDGEVNGAFLFQSANVTLRNNTVVGVAYGVVTGTLGSHTPTPDNVIEANEIRAQFSGLVINDGHRIVVADNDIVLTGGLGSVPWSSDELPSGRHGVFVYTGTKAPLVAGNTIRFDPLSPEDPRAWGHEPTRGISADAAVIEGNHVRGFATGIDSSGSIIANNTVVDNERGLRGGASSLVEANVLTGNDVGIATVPKGQPAFLGNVIDDNGVGVEIRGEGTLDVRHNWWGDASGPSGGVQDACTATTADGAGDVIDPGDAEVCFDPWLEDPDEAYPDANDTQHPEEGAQEDEEDPPVLHEQVADDAWVAAEVTVPANATWSVSFYTTGERCFLGSGPEKTGMVMTGAIVFDEDREPSWGALWPYEGSSVPAVNAGAQSDELGVDVHVEEGYGGVCLRRTFTWVGGPSTYTVVMWNVADSQDTEITVEADDAVEVHGTTHGTDTWLFQPEDFEGTARAHAQHGPWPEAWTAVDASVSLEAERTFLGAYATYDEELKRMDATTPDGERSCSCWFMQPQRPGTYRFDLTGASTDPRQDLWVTGADALLPW